MITVPPKIAGNQLSSTEYTDCTSQEAQNFVLDSGQALSGITDTQMVQAALRYQASGNQYVESGSGNAYVLTSRINTYALNAYLDGMKVQFLATHTNTGAISVNANALGLKTVVLPDGSAVPTGSVAIHNYITFTYDLSSDKFIYVSSTSGADTDLNAYKAELASQVNPLGTTLVGYTGETVKDSLDARLTTTELGLSTGAALIGKKSTGVNVGTGSNAQLFFSKFVGMALFSPSAIIFGNNLTLSALGSSKFRLNFITPLTNTNYIVLIGNESLTTSLFQTIQLIPNTRLTTSFEIQSTESVSGVTPQNFHKCWVYVIQH